MWFFLKLVFKPGPQDCRSSLLSTMAQLPKEQILDDSEDSRFLFLIFLFPWIIMDSLGLRDAVH